MEKTHYENKKNYQYGYPNSTAQNYADKYGIDFRSLDADFIINDGAETTSDKNVSIKFNDYAMDNYSKYKINGGEYADITTNTVAYTLDGEDGEKTVEITFSDGTNEKTITHTITLSTESTTGGSVLRKSYTPLLQKFCCHINYISF